MYLSNFIKIIKWRHSGVNPTTSEYMYNASVVHSRLERFLKYGEIIFKQNRAILFAVL
jgi:hypothetical protein